MKKKEQEIIEEIYNLILNPTISQEERAILLLVKNKIDINKKDSRKIIVELTELIRQLSIQNISKKRKLTPELATFYNKISRYCEVELNLARGLIATGLNFR